MIFDASEVAPLNRNTTVIPQDQVETQLALCDQVQAYWHGRGRRPLAYVETYGCQQNEADSERIRGLLTACGYEFGQGPEGADLVVMNTCAIREHAEQRVLGNLGALVHVKRRHPEQLICLCGCMMQEQNVIDKLQKSYRFIDLIFGTHNIFKFAELLCRMFESSGMVIDIWKDSDQIVEDLPVERKYPFKSGINIMFGCNNFCTYCIIPYARGRVRSMPLNAAVEQARGLAAEGYREIVINGIEISSWGWEWKNGSCLRQLLAALCEAVPGVRIRLGSLEPRTIDEAFCKTLSGYANLCPQFHLSLQSGSDTVLKRMHRKYDTARYLESVRLLRKYFPGCAVTTDLIVGFPGETEEEFAESLEFLKTCGLSMFHIFPYSRRKGTPAADMPDQIPNAVKERRAAEAASAAAELEAAYHASMLGTTQQVLFEQEENGLYAGHAMNYVKVYVQAAQLHNELRAVRVTDLCRDGVFGELE